MLADARKSPGPAGSPSWWAHDTFNNHKLFPCGWADRQTDRIYLQGRNCSETVTAALRDGCGEVLGFHGSPGVCRGRTALRRCRMGDGQRIWATNKPSIYIFCFLFQEASPLGWGFWLKEFKAMRLFYFFIFFLLVCVFRAFWVAWCKFRALQPWQRNCHDRAQWWQPPWGSQQVSFGGLQTTMTF